MMIDVQQLEERLYCIRYGLFVQYNGEGDVPPVIEQYQARNRGEFPPYMPLPKGPTQFCSGNGLATVAWPGHGPLPKQVLDHVTEYGVLPRTPSSPLTADREEHAYDDD